MLSNDRYDHILARERFLNRASVAVLSLLLLLSVLLLVAAGW
jgi:hypothetical protein